MEVPHLSAWSSSAGVRVNENFARQFEMTPASFTGRLQLMNEKGTQTPIVKGEGLGE